MIIGLDEVGRGPLAGPLLVSAVGLGDDPSKQLIDLLDDSKRITERRRPLISAQILQQAKCVAFAWVSAQEIDSDGLGPSLRSAFMQAAEKSVMQVGAGHQFIVDGSVNYLDQLDCESVAVVGADGKVAEVSAASIVAKVARDAYMRQLHQLVDDRFMLNSNKGYGSKAHTQAIASHGDQWFHRQSFIGKIKMAAANA